jgi:hypothetical protein
MRDERAQLSPLSSPAQYTHGNMRDYNSTIKMHERRQFSDSGCSPRLQRKETPMLAWRRVKTNHIHH